MQRYNFTCPSLNVLRLRKCLLYFRKYHLQDDMGKADIFRTLNEKDMLTCTSAQYEHLVVAGTIRRRSITEY